MAADVYAEPLHKDRGGWPSIKIVYNFNPKEYRVEIFQFVQEGLRIFLLFVNGIKQNDTSFTFK